MNNQYTNLPYSAQTQLLGQLQPQGMVYTINSSNELAAVPSNIGASAAFCFSEGLCYIKTYQNGRPSVVTYKITQVQEDKKEEKSSNNEILQKLEELSARLDKIEKTSKGGRLDELL